jgi:hypothetical protein
MQRGRSSTRVLQSFLAAFALFLAGCGGGGGSADAPPPASAPADVLLLGKLVAALPTAAPANAMLPKAGEPIEVFVQGQPSIKTTVGEDGTFTLRGLPSGSFTLVFTQLGVEIGTLSFQEVAPNQQITISVQLVGGEVVLVDEDRRGIGHAGIELEGLVDNVVTVSLTGDSTFVIAGRTVIARPGVTAIREGNTRRTVEDLKAGMRVHVKGTTLEGSTDVLAYEIKIQGPVQPGDNTAATMTICHIPPGKPEKRQTITIGTSAWPAHQAHGDTQGPC